MALIVLDAGHGGPDPGAVGAHGLREKDVVLMVVQEMARTLPTGGHSILLTREDDTFLTLSARASLANNSNADCFISIHCNAHDNREANGTETFAFSTTSRGAALAHKIQPSLVTA